MKNRSGQHSIRRDVPLTSGPNQTDPSLTEQIGPRVEGVDYITPAGAYRVLAVITNQSEARRILKRRAAQFAILVRDLHTGAEHATCAVWTGSDRVLKAVA